MERYDIEYNEITARSLNIKVAERINVPSTEFHFNSVTLPHRDGDLITVLNTVKDVVFPVRFIFKTKEEIWGETFRTAKNWLLGKGKKELEQSDDLEYFYKVKKVTIGTSERMAKIMGVFEAEFTCSGCQYVKKGKLKYEKEEVEYNEYHESKPIYEIVGEGVCTLTVNGSEMRANVGQNVTIDTERSVAYRKDGEKRNTSVKGEYEGLYLKSGKNEITITDGFNLRVVPNWRSL